MAHFDPTELRKVLGTFATGVTVITARAPDGTPIGLTANSFNSVSLDPPMVLWSLAKSALSRAAFEKASQWAVHILAADQEELANRFATRGTDKFAGLALDHAASNQAPLLHGCAARLQCRTSFMYEGGDHIIFVGEVLAVDHTENTPLVFHAGAYAVATKKVYGTLGGADPAGRGAESFGEDFLDYLLPRAHYQIYGRIREHHERLGLSDADYFVLVSLIATDGRGRAEIDAMFSPTGHHVTPQTVDGLATRGLIRHGTASQRLFLTEAGRRLGLTVLAAAKDIESEVLSKFTFWEAVSLKTLLKRLVQVTDVGSLPPMWRRPEETPDR
jgi:3-hydroxy-9,10-secoandrosta-1,3,5(10)-triene-9,17-dione monooxygenase reductase component